MMLHDVTPEISVRITKHFVFGTKLYLYMAF